MQQHPQLPMGSQSRVPRTLLGRNNYRIGDRLAQNYPGVQSLPSFTSLVAPLDEGYIEAKQPHHHAAMNVRRLPSFEQPLRELVGHDVIASTEASPLQTPSHPHAIDGDRLSIKAIGPDTYGIISDGRRREQRPYFHAKSATSDQPIQRKRRCESSSLTSSKHAETRRVKVNQEQKARCNQAICLQHMEDFLKCVLDWEAPKKQTPGNMTKSGLVGDKQQTMEAFYILNEVLVRRIISPLKSEPGESSLQTVAREAKCNIKTHLRDNSALRLPSCSLMVDEAPSGDRSCASRRDHEPCLLDRTSTCIGYRKHRRVTAFNCKLEELAATHDSMSSINPGPNRREERM